MDANEIAKLVLDYIRLNQPDAANDAELVGRLTRAFIAGYKSAQGFATVEAQPFGKKA